mmetsp:Transcript_1814/g.6307  ORF Transcript_1814/g.6307 Transcript_1814/m.6307 type:complete len:479 (+) Transcript_1814:69-1505(+)
MREPSLLQEFEHNLSTAFQDIILLVFSSLGVAPWQKALQYASNCIICSHRDTPIELLQELLSNLTKANATVHHRKFSFVISGDKSLTPDISQLISFIDVIDSDKKSVVMADPLLINEANMLGRKVLVTTDSRVRHIENKVGVERLFESLCFPRMAIEISSNDCFEHFKDTCQKMLHKYEACVVSGSGDGTVSDANGRNVCVVSESSELHVIYETFKQQEWIKVMEFVPGHIINCHFIVLEKGQTVILPIEESVVLHLKGDASFQRCGAYCQAVDISSSCKQKLNTYCTQLAHFLHNQYGFRGYINLDLIYTKSEELLPLEVNTRPGGSSPRRMELDSLLDVCIRHNLTEFTDDDLREKIIPLYEGVHVPMCGLLPFTVRSTLDVHSGLYGVTVFLDSHYALQRGPHIAEIEWSISPSLRSDSIFKVSIGAAKVDFSATDNFRTDASMPVDKVVCSAVRFVGDHFHAYCSQYTSCVQGL